MMYEVGFGKIDSTRFLNNIKSATSDLISIKIIAMESNLNSKSPRKGASRG